MLTKIGVDAGMVVADEMDNMVIGLEFIKESLFGWAEQARNDWPISDKALDGAARYICGLISDAERIRSGSV